MESDYHEEDNFDYMEDEEDFPILSSPQTQQNVQPPTRYLYFLAFFAAVGGFLFGYDTGVISGAMIPIKREFHLSYEMQEVVVSITLVGAIIGSITSAFLNDNFGRRTVLLIASFLFSLGAIFMGVANAVALIIVGRLLVGLGIGYASMTVPIYIAEAAPSNIRGKLVTLNQLLITFGIFIAAIINGLFSYITNGWRYMLGVAAVPSTIMFIGFLFMPESPRWLIINDQAKKARRVLMLLRGRKNVEEELNEITATVTFSRSQSFRETLKNVWKTPTTRRALLIGCGLQAFQQLSGINTVLYYSATIIEMAGVENQTEILWLAAAVASGNFIATLISMLFIEKIGRRRLMLLSLLGVSLGLCLLSATFFLVRDNSVAVKDSYVPGGDTCAKYTTCYSCIENRACGFCHVRNASQILYTSCIHVDTSVKENNRPTSCTSPHYHNISDPSLIKWSYLSCPNSFAWLAVLAMVVYLLMFAPGVGPMPWAINAEIYPLWARSVGVAAATTTNWTFNLLISFTFLNLIEWLTKGGAFITYAAICFSGCILFYLVLPETKGVKLEKVEDLFKGPVLVPFRK